MTECTQTALQFPGFSRRKIDVSFNGGDITSNGGVQLLRWADERTGLIKAAARAIGDSRRRKSCTHALESLVRQRVYGLSLGYEDLNDHEALRGGLGSADGAFPGCVAGEPVDVVPTGEPREPEHRGGPAQGTH